MPPLARSRRARAVAGALWAVLLGPALLGVACAAPSPAPAPTPACAAYVRYGDLRGTTVTVREPAGADDLHISGYEAFASCTGARILHEGHGALTAPNTPPDIGYVPDHATLTSLVQQTGTIRPASSPAAAAIAQSFPPTVTAAAGVNGTLYGVPLDADVKSLVWYSPKLFTERGYRVPQTWDELLTLSARIVADGGTPWCAGAYDGARTGAVLSDFLEDAVLRGGGADVFDQWVTHQIPADAPPVRAALDRVGTILRNPTFVNGGIGSAASIATTPVATAGRPILTTSCFLHRQAASYATTWPAGTTVAPDGDVFAFLLPPLEAGGAPTALVSGGFAVAFADRREVNAFQAYLASPEFAAARTDPLPSPNTGYRPTSTTGALARLALDTLQDPRTVLRYDGSDLMPPAVGSGSLPAALTAWIGGTGTAETLAAVEASRPRS